MKPKFLADNDLRSAIRVGAIRREPAIDFRSAHSASLDSVPDEDVLLYAATQGRIVITHDANTMPDAFWSLIANGLDSPGLFVAPQQAGTAPVIESLLLIWSTTDAAEWRNRVAWLPI